MKIPIWLTIKNIYKTIFSNLLTFVSLPTIVLLSLQFVGFYFYYYDLISFTLLRLITFLLTALVIVVCGPIISSLMQKYLLTGDNQLSFNKLIPKVDERQRKYIMFIMYICFWVYLFPQVISIILGFIMILYSSSLPLYSIYIGISIVLAIIIFIIFIYSMVTNIGASMVYSYISIYNTNFKLKELIKASSITLMGNKWRIFFITFIIFFSFGCFNGILNLIYKPQANTIAYYINSTIKIYISLLLYAIINVHIYLFFKDQFEANLVKLTEADSKTAINIDDDKLLPE